MGKKSIEAVIESNKTVHNNKETLKSSERYFYITEYSGYVDHLVCQTFMNV